MPKANLEPKRGASLPPRNGSTSGPKDQIYDPHFNKTFQDRKPDDFQMDFNLTIYSVGLSVYSALCALGKSIGWGKVENLEWQPVDIPCEWYVRFHAGGTSMKAAGQYVAGGVIVTWWK